MKKIYSLMVVLLMVFLSFNLYAQNYELWGMTTGGEGCGAIFKTDSIADNMQLEYEFDNYGQSPANVHFAQDTNGYLYGLANGGKYGHGVLFRFDPNTNIYVRLHSFREDIDGKTPFGGLLLANNNKFYGMCQYGGLYHRGTIYEFDPITDSFQTVFNFDTMTTGGYPKGGLIQASNGKLYGLTSFSSWINQPNIFGGTLFEFDISTYSLTRKVTFAEINTPYPNIGCEPMGDLIQATNGKLYGMTQLGGATINNMGVIFEYDIQLDSLAIKHSFTGGNEGGYPNGSLIQLSNGKLYGFAGDALFEYNLQNNQYSVKYQFSYQNGKGHTPSYKLALGPNGKLYGLCYDGGNDQRGTLFEFNPQNQQVVKKIDLNKSTGFNPVGALFLATDGYFYGMTPSGGISRDGTIFKYNSLSDSFNKVYDFYPSPNGRNPYGSLLQASNGLFYGMTRKGGIYDRGIIFEFNPKTNTFLKRFDFNDTLGTEPYGSLMQASNGKLYGMTSSNSTPTGGWGNGITFEFNLQNNQLSVLQNFNNWTYGGHSYGDLVEGDSSRLYGLVKGSTGGRGNVFEYDMVNDTFYSSYSFNNINLVANPEGSLLYNGSGELYGLSKDGGAYSKGGIFMYNAYTKTTTLKASFNGNNGQHPTGNLIKASNGKFYGLTPEGGANNMGVLFEYSSIGIVKKVDFAGLSNGAKPRGSLMMASNGKLYGMTTEGGLYNKGVLFEYDITTGIMTIKNQFDGFNGAKPYYSFLMEYNKCQLPVYDTITVIACGQYLSPGGKIFTQSGVFIDTIATVLNCDSIITINLSVTHIDTTISISGNTLSSNNAAGTYQWIDCGASNSPIAGAINQSFTPSTNGYYAVIIQNNNCIDTSYCHSISILGIQENKVQSKIFVFPNPSNGNFNVDLKEKYEKIDLFIRNSSGQIILSKQYKQKQTILFHIEGPSGIYFMELISSEGKRFTRILIKK